MALDMLVPGLPHRRVTVCKGAVTPVQCVVAADASHVPPVALTGASHPGGRLKAAHGAATPDQG